MKDEEMQVRLNIVLPVWDLRGNPVITIEPPLEANNAVY